jgi:CHASE3 domain sensor protein
MPMNRWNRQYPVVDAWLRRLRRKVAEMNWQMGNRLVFGGFAMATAILVFVGWQSYRSTGLLVEAASWRDHTYEVLNSLDETIGQLSDAETGQRGYLLTGDETYLEPYRAAIKTVNQTVARLKNLTSDNPHQQKRIQALESQPQPG